MKTLLLLGALALQDPAPRWRLEPVVVQVGQPITCQLEVLHPVGARPDGVELDLDFAWEVVSGPDSRPVEGGTLLTWTVLALEPGEHLFGALDLGLADGSRMRIQAAALEVHGERAGVVDDQPRAFPGFRKTTERTSPMRPRHLLAGLMVLLLAGVSSFVFWRRSRRDREADQPTELERFRGLAWEEGDYPGLAAELTRLVRSAVDRHAGFEASRDALTDEEWLEGLRQRDTSSVRDTAGLEALLGQCTGIKFAGVRPTRFAIDDLRARSEAMLVHMDRAPDEQEPSS